MVENFVRVSAHAGERMHERFGFERTDVKQNIAERAWKNGKTYRDYSGKARTLLYEIQTRHKDKGFIVKAYSDRIFVFNKSGVLCTAYDEPTKFKKFKSKMPVYRESRDYDYDAYYDYAA